MTEEKIGSQLKIKLPDDYKPEPRNFEVTETSQTQLTITAISGSLKVGDFITMDDSLWWPNCSIEYCPNKSCLSLNSDKCFPHTPGWTWWKHCRIKWYRIKMFWNNRIIGALMVLRGKAEAIEE